MSTSQWELPKISPAWCFVLFSLLFSLSKMPITNCWHLLQRRWTSEPSEKRLFAGHVSLGREQPLKKKRSLLSIFLSVCASWSCCGGGPVHLSQDSLYAAPRGLHLLPHPSPSLSAGLHLVVAQKFTLLWNLWCCSSFLPMRNGFDHFTLASLDQRWRGKCLKMQTSFWVYLI